MKYFGACLLLLSLSVHAQKSLSPQAFQSNVRPVLSGILSDFYQMISLFPEFPKGVVDVIENMDTLTLDKDLIKEGCPKSLNPKCLSALISLKNKLEGIKSRTLKALSSQQISESPYMNSLGGMRLFTEFHTKLEEVDGLLANDLLMMKADISKELPTFKVIKLLDDLNTLISLSIVEFIPFTYKEDFRHFFFNFVHPVQLQISKNMNYEFLNRNVNSLNFAVNLLNMNLTKRNKKTPAGFGPYLATIHNRWNSILRYYF